MEIEFQITLEEFAEANRFHQRPTPAHLRKLRPTVIISAVATIIAVFGYLAGQQRWGFAAHPDEPADPLMNYIVLPIFPWMAILGGSALIVWRGAARPSSEPWEGERVADAPPPKRRSGRLTKSEVVTIVSLIMYLAAFVVLQYTMDLKTGLVVPSVTSTGLAAVPMIFWASFQLWALAVNRISVGRAIADSWELQTQLQRPLKMEFTAQGVVIETLFSRSRYAWEYFPGCRETPLVFLLYISPAMFHIVPKRALASESDLDGLRYMLRDLPGQRPSAFPVIPIPPAVVAPLTADES
jgi:hypothetical protein